ncbi:hypothetical protein ACIPY6_40665 [Streptomyces sp. NPDC090054]
MVGALVKPVRQVVDSVVPGTASGVVVARLVIDAGLDTDDEEADTVV